MKTFKTSLFVLRYHAKPIIPPVALRYLNASVHPIRPKIAHMYANRDRNTLWWRVSVRPIQPLRRVVRSWGARRARAVFQQALEERGFDREGRGIPDSIDIANTKTKTKTSKNLTGSLEIVVLDACIKEKFPKLQEDMGSVVDGLIREASQQK